MSDGTTEQLKKFIFSSKYNCQGQIQEENLEVIIPELLQASYSFYTWPSAPVLAWFLWEHRKELVGLQILEIGSGTALPGIVAAKCGAKVTLSDSATLPKSLAHTQRCCQLNNLVVNQHVRIIGLTWGLFLNNLSSIGPVDLILGSDCFYEPAVFEDILVTVSYLLEANPAAKFLCTYQERSSDWSIEHLLSKWNLKCQVHNINNLGQSAGIDIHDLIGDHSIHLLEISRLYVGNLPWTVSHNELKQYFSKYGHVSSATVVFDRNTGLSRNYGFVLYSNRDGFNSALNIPTHKLEGHSLKVEPSAADVPNYADLEELGIDLDEVTEKFTQAADHLKKLVSKLDDKTLLVLYGYYKQGLEGPCNSPKPSWYNTKGRAKWEAWNKLGNMPQVEAKTLYTQLVESLDPEFLSAPKEGWVSISTMQPEEDILNESEKSLVDYVKEGNCTKVTDILRSYSAANVASAINKLDDDGMGLIHWAADRGSSEVLKAILSFGGDVNFVDSDMQTPLHYAASCGHVDCITVLLKNKADVSLKDADGLEPSAVASDENVRELLQNFA